MGVDSIKNYRYVNENISTGGQPSRVQYEALAKSGVARVVNLATENAEKFNEPAVAEELGIAYISIPVDWSSPKSEDFERFTKSLDDAKNERVFIHCAANYRVTGFYALYAMARYGWTDVQVEDFISVTWNPDKYPVWREFINNVKRENDSVE